MDLRLRPPECQTLAARRSSASQHPAASRAVRSSTNAAPARRQPQLGLDEVGAFLLQAAGMADVQGGVPQRAAVRTTSRSRPATGGFDIAVMIAVAVAPLPSPSRAGRSPAGKAPLFVGSYSRFGRLRTVGGHVPSAVKWQTRKRLARSRTVRTVDHLPFARKEKEE